MDRWHILPSMGYELNKITLGGTLGLVEGESSWNKERRLSWLRQYFIRIDCDFDEWKHQALLEGLSYKHPLILIEKLMSLIRILIIVSCCGGNLLYAADPASFHDLFNGRDLTGWVDVNTSPETWSVRDGLLVCSGHPIGVMRSERQYENFVLHIEWRHVEAGGNSGIFIWSERSVPAGRRLPKGMEVQMLELDWVKQHAKPDGTLPPIAYVHGELFGANGLHTLPDNPRGSRSK
jgi:hypothetical protein